jgi:hypothetical protein
MGPYSFACCELRGIFMVRNWYYYCVLIPNYDSRPDARPHFLPHGSLFVLTFSILACIAAGFLIPLGIEVLGPQHENKTARLAAAAFGSIVLLVSLFLMVVAAALIIGGHSYLRLWKRLLLFLPPTIAVLMSGFVIFAGSHE